MPVRTLTAAERAAPSCRPRSPPRSPTGGCATRSAGSACIETDGGLRIIAFDPGAADAVLTDGAGAHVATARQGPLWRASSPRASRTGRALRLSPRLLGDGQGLDGATIPIAFGPVLGELDDYLLAEGRHAELWKRLGAHPMQHEGVEGVAFAVWAPNARRVSVVGEFNFWDGRRHPMRLRYGSGVWEIFLPGVGPGALYKYEIVGRAGRPACR